MAVGREINSLAGNSVIVLRSPTHNVFRALIEKKVWDLKVRRSIQLGQSRPNHPDHRRNVIKIRRAGEKRRKLYSRLTVSDDGIALSAWIPGSRRAGRIVPPAVASVGAGASAECIDPRAIALK